MKWLLLLLLLLPLSLAACDTAPEATSNAATPVSIALPEETAALPATPAGERVGAACAACHSPDMITRQPVLSPAQWAATVAKMRDVYKASYAPDEDAAIVAALVELQTP